MKIGPLIIAGLVGIVILVGVAALLLYRANLNKTKQKINKTKQKKPTPSAAPTPGANNKTKPDKSDWATWSSSVLVIASSALLLILTAVFWPALWEWLRGQGKVFWLLAMTLLAVAIAVKYKPVWWLVAIAGLVILFSVEWTTMPGPRDWSQSSLEKVSEAAAKRQVEYRSLETSRVPSDTSFSTGRVTTRTIIAPPNGFSKMVSIPRSNWFRWDAQTDGCYQIKNGRGEIRQSCGDEHVYLGDRVSLLDSMLSFGSLTGSEVQVIVEWEPK